jgi:hypothetical protein
MAHLLVHDSATPLWEQVTANVDASDRPAFLDQTDGAASAKLKIGDLLISVANGIKHNLDDTMFSAEYIGAEASAMVSDIDPSVATFSNAKELFALQTQYVNLHDALLTNLDCSGSGAAVGTLARRMNCFEKFVGQVGRNKDVGLFYCFVVWEGRNTRWLSKRLPNDVVRRSTGRMSPSLSPPACPPSANSFSGMKKKQVQPEQMSMQMAMMRETNILMRRDELSLDTSQKRGSQEP